jgi:hypothetical protein
VRAERFKAAVRTGVVVTVGSTTEANVDMSLGPLAEQVTVVRDAAHRAGQGQLSRVVGMQEIESLPIAAAIRRLRQAVERRGERA